MPRQNNETKKDIKEPLVRSEEILRKRRRDRIFRIVKVSFFLALAMGFVLSIAFLWYAVQGQQRELQSAREELLRQQGLLEVELFVREDFERVDENVLPALASVLPREEELHEIFEELDAIGERTGISLSLSLRSVISEGDTQVLPIHITTRATASQLRQIFEELETFSSPIVVKEYALTSSGSVQSPGNAELLVHLFVRFQE